MPDQSSGYSTRDATEVRGRIADILGYCNLDGRLHDPENFEKKMARSKWVCPDCSTVAGKVAYKRAKELRWMLIPPNGVGSSMSDRQDTTNDTEPEEGADLADGGSADDEETTADDGSTDETDSEDVKARIESAQEDIEELESTAGQ
jgi:hypothetical protein